MTKNKIKNASTLEAELAQIIEILGGNKASKFLKFFENMDKFADSMGKLTTFINNQLTEAQKTALNGVRLENISRALHLSPEVVFGAEQTSIAHGGKGENADKFFEKIQTLARDNPKTLADLAGKLGVQGDQLVDKQGNAQPNILQTIQDALVPLKPLTKEQVFGLLDMPIDSGLRAALTQDRSTSGAKSISAEMAFYKDLTPTAAQRQTDSAILTKNTEMQALWSREQQIHLSKIATGLLKVADSIAAIEKAHPELVAEGLLGIHGAMLLFLSTTTLITGAETLASIPVTKKIIDSLTKASAKYGKKGIELGKTKGVELLESGKNAIKKAPEAGKAIKNAATKAAPLVRTAGKAATRGLLGTIGVETAAFEGLSAAEIAGFAVSGLLAPEILVPALIIGAGTAAGAGLYYWYNHRSGKSEDKSGETQDGSSPKALPPPEAPATDPPSDLAPSEDETKLLSEPDNVYTSPFTVYAPAPKKAQEDLARLNKQIDQAQHIKSAQSSAQNQYFRHASQQASGGQSVPAPISATFGDFNIYPQNGDPEEIARTVKRTLTDSFNEASRLYGGYR